MTSLAICSHDAKNGGSPGSADRDNLLNSSACFGTSPATILYQNPIRSVSLQVLPGSPLPLGAHCLPGDSDVVNFAIYSRHATAVDLCFFDSDDSCL